MSNLTLGAGNITKGDNMLQFKLKLSVWKCTFASVWNGKTGIICTLWPIRNWTKLMKQQFTRVRKNKVQDSDPWNRENEWEEAYNCPTLLPRTGISSVSHGWEIQVDPGVLPEMRRQNWIPEIAGQLDFTRDVSDRRKLKTEALQSSAQVLPWVSSVSVGENHRILKTAPPGSGGKMLSQKSLGLKHSWE